MAISNINIIKEIVKLKNKLKRNEERIEDTIKTSELIRNEIEQRELTYTKQIAPEFYISLDTLQKQLGEDIIGKVQKHLVHVSKLKDFKWQESKFDCWLCQSENHMNICVDNSINMCDRKLSKCIGIKSTIIQVKHQDTLF